ncbi:MAG TPA: hypothetical protein VFL77_08015 [Solirubrobacterales bacterium]|nr:hypothetical protein [Solirubrobacterales bacterium]
MSSRGRVSAKVERRRALVVDLACAALVAIVAILVSAGIGVVGVGALIVLVAALAWVGIEAALARGRRRSPRR